MIHGLSVCTDGKTIEAEDLPFVARAEKDRDDEPGRILLSRTYKEAMEEYEKKLLDEVLCAFSSVSDAARHLDMDRSTLFRKIKAWKKRGVLLGKRHVKIVEKT